MKKLLILSMIFIITGIGCKNNQKRIKIAFITDLQVVHMDHHPYGGSQSSPNVAGNWKIPKLTESALNNVNPDLIFDTGDLTAKGREIEFKAYNNWKENQCAPVYAVQGNHDRRKNTGYGSGFYSECGYTSATRTIKMGNSIFILISENSTAALTDHGEVDLISEQRLNWIKNQLQKYSNGNNNIFIFEHYPLNGTVAWSDFWWANMGSDIWKKTSNQVLNIIENYEDHVIAHISGHLHTHYAWKDIPADSVYFGWGDGVNGPENVGHFVNGADYNHLPEVYFFNPQALAYWHSPPGVNTAAIYPTTLCDGDSNFVIKVRDILNNRIMDSYRINTDYPIDLGKGEIEFMGSDLGFRSFTGSIWVSEDKWFKVKEGQSGTAIFQKRYPKKVDIEKVAVSSTHGSYKNVEYKGSSDTGESWSSWSSSPPKEVDVVQVKMDFLADAEKNMEVYDVKLVTK